MNKKKMKRAIQKTEVKLTNEKIYKIKEEATTQALAMILPLAMLALRDAEGFGKKRLLRFHDKILEINDDINDGRLNIKDIEDVIGEEVGIKFTDGGAE
ncbi:hypothetical protein [Jeotgalibaca porci]|uniref:hypothetical protein n=1 Tax=Jeotgalibaca porci TaxID=1868793 RepID=UPI0035A016B6